MRSLPAPHSSTLKYFFKKNPQNPSFHLNSLVFYEANRYPSWRIGFLFLGSDFQVRAHASELFWEAAFHGEESDATETRNRSKTDLATAR